MWGWRSVGTFKGKDICLEDLVLKATDAGVLLRSQRWNEEKNRERILELKTKNCERYLGITEPVVFINEDKIDCKGTLPEVTAWAYLTCGAVVADHSEMESHLVLIWLQKGHEDPFLMLREHLRALDWAAFARDCSP